MEFIEGEKNFNKILCRLSAIMHQDDPRYLDLTFDRTLEQRKKYKQDVEAATAAAATLSSAAATATAKEEATKENAGGNDVVEALDPNLLDSEVEASIRNKKLNDRKDAMDLDELDKDVNMDHQNGDMDENNDIDTEAQEVVKKVKELLLVSLCIVLFAFV